MKRYTIFNSCSCDSLVILERDLSDEGAWIKYEDVKSLQEENKQLRETLEEIEEEPR